MHTIPTDLKKQNIILFLKPKQRLAFGLTNKKELEWIKPVLKFRRMSIAEKLAFIKSAKRAHITDDLIVEALSKELDNVLLELMSALPDTHQNKNLKHKIQKLMEKRLCDRNYKKLIKRTLLKTYIQYLLHEKKSVARFINGIESREVRSQAIEQYLLLTKDEMTPTTRKKWVEQIPDTYTREKTARMLQRTIRF